MRLPWLLLLCMGIACMVRQRGGMAPPEAANKGMQRTHSELALSSVWLELAVFVSSTTATSLSSDSTFHPEIWKHSANRLINLRCILCKLSHLYTRKYMEGLQRVTFPEIRFYWSHFPTLWFKYSTILSSQKFIASWHFRTSFRIQRNAPSTGGRRAVDSPSHNQKLFCSKAAPAERGASYCAIHCTQSQAFSSLSKNGTKGNISYKRKTIWKKQCWSAVLQI